MTKFTDNQRRIFKVLTWTGVCRFYLEKDKSGLWRIKQTPWWRIIYYYLLWVNTSLKVIYLFLTYQGWLNEVHFLDQMSIWDWWLCAAELANESNIWYRKYPLYEVIGSNWTIMENIFQKLGSPAHIQQKIIKNNNYLQILHLSIAFWGGIALMIQFFMSPKYVLNTYAIFPSDTPLWSCVFAAHEYFFMVHCWNHLTFTVVLVEVFAVAYTELIKEMTNVVKILVEKGQEKSVALKVEHFSGIESKKTTEGQEGANKMTKMKYLDPEMIADGTCYNISSLIQDYKSITLAMNQYNAWVGKRMAGVMLVSYGQFVLDVFMMIQLLKEPDVDFLGVFFFFEDAVAGMVLIFLMIILQSKLLPTSRNFFRSIKIYMQHDTPLRNELSKTISSLRIVSSKIGSVSVSPALVPVAINQLINFYISAAMWKRPADRRT